MSKANSHEIAEAIKQLKAIYSKPSLESQGLSINSNILLQIAIKIGGFVENYGFYVYFCARRMPVQLLSTPEPNSR